ncbi:SseB family protein [Streptococcus sp. H31]|uniref:SseB family protein n=1 Tax=Streptococcus huangxiaojuni TaxID=3237239 RepID=UPI0034A1DE49
MSKIEELDVSLRKFIADPDHFLDSIALVNALHSYPVLASDQPYILEISGQQVTPVFTDFTDLDNFKKEEISARNQHWTKRSALTVLEEGIAKGSAGLAFNLKKTGDFGNSTIFSSKDMIQFLATYSSILDHLLNEKNLQADTMDKYYLVPVYIHPQEDNHFERLFPIMATPEGERYVPIFSNLVSFAKWYNKEEFGGAFRQAQGLVLTWKIEDIYKPREGQAETEETFGLAVNPFDEEQILINWSDIDV